MVTAGVVIALAEEAEEDMSAAAATAVTALMRPTADTLHRERALAAREPRRRAAVHPVVLLMPQPMVLPPTVELLTVAVADRMAVANIASLS
jgi:hypothetical protein